MLLPKSTPGGAELQSASASRCNPIPPRLKKYQVWIHRANSSTLLVDSDRHDWAVMRFNLWAFAGSARASLTVLLATGRRQMVLTSQDPDNLPVPFTLTDKGRAALHV